MKCQRDTSKWDIPESWNVDEVYDKMIAELYQEVEAAKKWDWRRNDIQQDTGRIEQERSQRLDGVFGRIK